MRSLKSRALASFVAALTALAAMVGVLALSPAVSGAKGHHLHSAGTSASSGSSTQSNSVTANKVNAPTGAQFQVCDVAGDTGQSGVSFPILQALWTGTSPQTYSLTASSPPGGCGAKFTTSPGTVMAVEQATSPGVPVPNVKSTFAVTNGTLDATVLPIAFAAVTVNSGLTVLTITNTTPPPPTNGTLELCKFGADSYVSGSFNFTITGAGNFSSNQVVPTGQCNDVTVPSGNVNISEAVKFPYALASVATSPTNALVSSNIGQQSAVVSVPPNGATTVAFTNATLEGYAKICKALDRSEDNVLAGQTFTFPVTVTFQGATILTTSVSVTAAPFGTTTCTFISNRKGPLLLPLGSTVTATETVPSGAPFRVVGTSISPANLDAGSSIGTAVFYVGNLPAPNNVGNLGAGSVTQATFTNEALGSVKVCKTSSSINQGTPFNFSVGGTPIGSVEVGFCSLPITLPVGTTTVTETPRPHISTFLSTTKGGSLSGTTATVTVPFNDQNDVTFDNEINSGQFEYCKAQTSPDAALDNTAFNLSYSFTVNGVPHTGSASLKPGQCTLPVTVPVLNSDLSQVTISITEGTTSVSDVQLTAINLTGPDTVVSSPSFPHLVSLPGGTPATIVLNSLEGSSTVTFVNGRTAGSPG